LLLQLLRALSLTLRLLLRLLQLLLQLCCSPSVSRSHLFRQVEERSDIPHLRPVHEVAAVIRLNQHMHVAGLSSGSKAVSGVTHNQDSTASHVGQQVPTTVDNRPPKRTQFKHEVM
jgi:hypothetical protein